MRRPVDDWGKGMDSKLATLFGGGGFVGRAVAEELFARGWRVRIAQRDPRRAFAVRALGRIGQIQFAAADITQADSVARAVAGSDAVINLVGILNGDFDAIQATGARNVAEGAARTGAGSFVQVSAIGADAASPSAYGRSKAAGEAAVRHAFPAATIIRPSIIFGRDDGFTNRFAQLIRALPIVPVIAGDTKLQPVFVGDVAEAVAAAASEPLVHAGHTYELGGPDVMSMAEINHWLANAIGRDRSFVAVPDAAARALATLTGWAPGAPITSDQLAMLGRDNVVADGAAGFSAFGIRPRPMAAVAPDWLIAYRKHGRFGDRVRV